MLPSDCFVIHTCEYHHETYFQRLALTNRNRPNVTTICQGRNSSIFMPSRTTLSTTISLSILPVLITSLEWPNREYLRCKVARPFAGRIEPLANQHNCFGYWYCGFFVIGVCSPHWNRSCLLPVLFRGDFALLLMVEWSKHSDWYSKRLRLGCRCHALMLTHVLDFHPSPPLIGCRLSTLQEQQDSISDRSIVSADFDFKDSYRLLSLVSRVSFARTSLFDIP